MEETHRGAACPQRQTPRVSNSMADTKLKQKQLYLHGASARALKPTEEHFLVCPKHQRRSVRVGGSGEGGTKDMVRLGQQFLAAA